MSSYLDSPMYREMLAKTLQGNSGPQYPAQAGANALAQILQAYMLKSMGDQDVQKQQAGNQSLANALLPGTDVPSMSAQAAIPASTQPAAAPPDGAQPGGIVPRPINIPASTIDVSTPAARADDPNNAGLVAALNGGAITPDSLAPALMQKFGIGAAKEPLKLGPGDIAFDPVTHQPIPGMSAPFKPEAPQRPEATPDIIQIAKQLYPDDPKAQSAYIVKNSPANLRAITNINNPKQNWQILTDPKTQTQYRYDLDSGKALTLDGQPYTPGGAQKLMGGQPRSAASLAATMYLQEHPDATADDLTKFAANYGKTIKSTTAFGAGKQGDLVRSFNVAVSHLNTLDGLVGALGNGDVQALNKFSNAIAQQTGNPAPTNFDAAKAIVGDEIIKAIVGGGGALADRENAQNQISRANSPAQLRGVINTYKELMAGQLRGLKKQYSDTTGQGDFDERLSPETRAELEKTAGPANTKSGGPARIAGDADYAKLPSGAEFIGPDGVHRKKP